MFPKDTKILIVDDMAGIRQSLKSILRELGYTDLTTAENGRVAYDNLCQAVEDGKSFDLVLSDWNMPVLSGIELLKLIRIHPALKNMPFLMVTAEGEYSQVKVALSYKLNGYIIKPFNSSTLKTKLEQAWKMIQNQKNKPG